MITINKENLDETRIERRNTAKDDWPFDDILGAESSPEAGADKDSTQRLFVSESISKMPPIRRAAPSGQPRPAASAQHNSAPQQRPAATATQQRRPAPAPQRPNPAVVKKKKQEKTVIIVLCILVALLLISIIGVVIATMTPTADDGKIRGKVFAAGVDLSGMTIDQAKIALRQATDDTYSQLDMTVQVLDTTITLSPKETGARLDVNGVVQAAYAYGRDIPKNGGNAAYTVDILPYLSLDTGYIQSAVQKLGRQYSTTLTPTTYRVNGIRPEMNPNPATVDTTRIYQVLHIELGTAEYGLNTDRLYQQILDAYNINLFQVTGECSVRAPEPLDWEAIFAEICMKPQDASIDPNTYQITPEVYGYGFTMATLNARLSEANYGETIKISMSYIEPDITTELLSGDLFKDVLSSFQMDLSSDENWNINMQLICDLLNGTTIKSGNTFSFNNLVGEPTVKRGFQSVDLYIGKSLTSVVGGGMSQVATALYNCALLADLPVTERNAHTYAPSFIEVGLDAQVYYGKMDLQFVNTTEQPLKIEAAIADGRLEIRLVGTESRTHRTEIVTQITTTKRPGTDYITLPYDPLGMYADGDILAEGITGYTVSVYKYTYALDSELDPELSTETLLSEELISETTYAKRNAVVAKVEPEEIPDVTDPSDPMETEPSDPMETEPSTEEIPNEEDPME